jgi:5-methylcytosine-specific restriction protein B
LTRYQDSPIYDVAQRFVDVALRRDDSLFTPGRAIWAPGPLEELNERYVQNPDLGAGSFESKLQGQLHGASPEAIQLMAEALFVYFLPARWNISGATKRQKIGEILAWIPGGPTLPPDLAMITDEGVGSGGPGFNLYKWASLSFLLAFARRWKQLDSSSREVALSDPWKFRDFVIQIPTDGGGIYGRESLLHIVFPDTFERVFSGTAKARLANTLKSLVEDPDANIDLRLAQIRGKLAARFGPNFDFYDTDGVRALWRPFDDPLNEFIYWASRFHELSSFVPDERTYKLEIVNRLTAARTALLEEGEWFPLFKRSFNHPPNNLTNYQSHDPFLKWCQDDLPRAAKLLRRIWAGDDEPLGRLGDFLAHLPNEVVSGMGSRTTLGSFLLMGIDPYTYPPYRTAAMHAAYRLTGFKPGDEKNEVAMYRAALAFLDKVRSRAGERGLELSDRLDAQSVSWSIANSEAPAAWPAEDRAAFDTYRQGKTDELEDEGEVEIVEPTSKPISEEQEPYADPLVGLAEELLISHTDLVEMRDLLRAKRQLIAYGPPGTGKTYVAQKLAVALAGDKTRVRLVQFHPSYAYEDFVEGFRPKAIGGVPGFELTPGPMKSLADQAIEDPGHDYYLIIDELNRGNIAKIFGELYFLLEYRDEEMLLQYSSRPFRLPKNLFLIGTMNTADRSIALLDAALRRRFVFIPFFPDRPPIQGVLGRWLQRHRPDMAFVAEVVDLANRKLADRNSAIGPSYFIDAELNDLRLARVWRHEIMPLLEDYFFDAPERLQEFALDRLRKELRPAEIGIGQDAITEAGAPDQLLVDDGPPDPT